LEQTAPTEVAQRLHRQRVVLHAVSEVLRWMCVCLRTP
jgi:hypothetical protein